MDATKRDALQARIIQVLSADTRVAAAWLTGSVGRGEADAWSDLDLHVAIFDEHLEPFWTDRVGLYEMIGRPVLIQREMPSNAQAGGHFQLVIFDGPLEVDWNVGPLSRARRAPSHVLLFGIADVPLAELPSLPNDELCVSAQERLIFLWTMAPIAVKYIARGDTTRAIRQIGLVRDAFVALWRLVDTGRPTINGFNQPLEPELARTLPRFGSQIGPPDCLVALVHLCVDTERLHSRLQAVGVVVPHEMPQQLADLIAELPFEVERTGAEG
jgi:predicted nucleotidyltransferase